MIRTKKAAIDMPKLVMILVVIIAISAFSGKMYAQSKHKINETFDPNQYYSTTQEEEDAVASSLADYLSKEAKEGARDLSMTLFGHGEFGAKGNGKLVLLTDVHYKHPFFEEQDGTIGIKYATTSKHQTLVYLTKTVNGIEQKSLFMTSDTDNYLKRNFCIVSDSHQAPLISAVTGIPTDKKLPSSLSIQDIPQKYAFSTFGLRPTSGWRTMQYINGEAVQLNYEATYLTGAYKNPSFAFGNGNLVLVPGSYQGASKNKNFLWYTGGLLVWVYENNFCIMERAFTYGSEKYGHDPATKTFEISSGLGYDYNTGKLVVVNNDGRISDLLLMKLIDDGYVTVI